MPAQGRRLPPIWEKDGPLVASLRRQLGVLMGKTHMVEFAFGGTSLNSHWGDAAQSLGCRTASIARRILERRGS